MKVLSILVLFFAVTSAHASTILSVDDTNDVNRENGVTVAVPGARDESGVGVNFTLASSLTNASFELDFFCVPSELGGTGVCGGNLILSETGLGPNSDGSPNILVAASQFSIGSGESTLTAFSGIDLAAGSYAVLLAADQSLEQVGFWLGSPNAVASGDGSASAGAIEKISTLSSNSAIDSVFEPVTNLSLYYRISADTESVAPVPLPSSAFFVLAGLAGLSLLRKKTKTL